MIALSFWALTLLCCGYGAALGGRDARRVAITYILGCLATVGAWYLEKSWTSTNVATFAVDLVLLIAFWWIALRSDRWFPCWIAGFHLEAVMSHVGSMVAPGYAFKLYFFLQGLWSVPMLLVLVAGVMLDRRGGLVDDQSPAQPSPTE